MGSKANTASALRLATIGATALALGAARPHWWRAVRGPVAAVATVLPLATGARPAVVTGPIGLAPLAWVQTP